MLKVRRWFGQNVNTQRNLTAKHLGHLDVRLVMFVHNFSRKNSWVSMDEICRALVKEVPSSGGDITKSPWPLPDEGSGAAITPAAPILELATDGSIPKSQLKTLQYGIGLDCHAQAAKMQSEKRRCTCPWTCTYITLPNLKITT